jgi:hypothetical protein
LSRIIFSYDFSCYYIDSILSFEKWNWWFILDLFLLNTRDKWIFLEDAAMDKFSGFIINDLYYKRWFYDPEVKTLCNNKILFKWNVWINKQWKILNKYNN